MFVLLQNLEKQHLLHFCCVKSSTGWKGCSGRPQTWQEPTGPYRQTGTHQTVSTGEIDNCIHTAVAHPHQALAEITDTEGYFEPGSKGGDNKAVLHIFTEVTLQCIGQYELYFCTPEKRWASNTDFWVPGTATNILRMNDSCQAGSYDWLTLCPC